MRKKLEIIELTVVVRAQNHNPTILNPDFLKYNDIVPPEWELAENPVCSDLAAKVRYKNGVSILAQPNRIAFSESRSGILVDESLVPGIVKKYCETLPHAKYTASGINSRGLVVADSEAEAEGFVLDKLVTPGPWATFGGGPKTVKATFVYSVSDAQLTLHVEPGETAEDAPYPQGTPIVVFGANFHREVSVAEPSERIKQLGHILDHWSADIAQFRSLVDNCFLQSGDNNDA